MTDLDTVDTGPRLGAVVHPAVPGTKRLTADVLWTIPRVGAPAPSPDGARLVVPVTTWPDGATPSASRLWLMDADGSGARPITALGTKASAPAWSPGGTRLAYVAAPRDDDGVKPQVHVLRLDGGEPEVVTDLPLGAIDARWLPDGRLVVASRLLRDHPAIDETRAELERREDDPVKAHASEDRLVRFWDRWMTGGETARLFVVDPDGEECRDLTPGFVGWFDFMDPTGQFDVAPDGSEIAWSAVIVRDGDEQELLESRVHRVAVDGGPIECLRGDAPADTWRPRYAPDGRTIVYGRNEDRFFYADRARLHRFDRETGTHAPWCTDWDHAPVQWEYAADGSLVFVAEANARTHVYALAPGDRTPRCVAEGATIGSPAPAADGRVYATVQSLHRATEVHRVPLAGGPTEPVTSMTAEALDDVALGEVREIEVVGAEGERVQSWVVLPPDHDATTPAPFVNVVHGGPHGAWGDHFHYRWNPHVFAAPGYVVALPNFQGSTSWGNDYSQRIQGEWGRRPFVDVMAVTDRLVASGLVDENRMAAAGGSYGGYLVTWIAAHTDRFRCLVNHAGVYNLLSMYGSDVTQGRPRAYGGDAWTDLEAIDRYSPARHTADMTTPMLVIHGERDYRVPVGQALECYGVLKAKGVPARLLHFPDENHWILKPHNSKRWYEEVHAWLARWMG